MIHGVRLRWLVALSSEEPLVALRARAGQMFGEHLDERRARNTWRFAVVLWRPDLVASLCALHLA